MPKTCLLQAGARRQGRRRTTILQVLANAVPPPGGIKSALPEGKLFSKTAAFMAAFKLMCDMQAQHSHNSLILKHNFLF
ncbi:MAG: hypothetical protein DRH37_09875 [Deltaproteobacteria bacterium]|nr:MAG: hypothetical protein DRH37_09875 [Deltaproteobacteria bacterium]